MSQVGFHRISSQSVGEIPMHKPTEISLLFYFWISSKIRPTSLGFSIEHRIKESIHFTKTCCTYTSRTPQKWLMQNRVQRTSAANIPFAVHLRDHNVCKIQQQRGTRWNISTRTQHSRPDWFKADTPSNNSGSRTSTQLGGKFFWKASPEVKKLIL